MSARTVLSRGQQVSGATAVLVFVLCLVLAPRTTAAIGTAVLSLGFLAGVVFNFWVSMVGARFDLVEQVSAADIEALDESTLPTYTVLVPVFREANSVHNLGASAPPTVAQEVSISRTVSGLICEMKRS
ncbi:hypothetical protein [Curtobacterium luteum]|uniref:hypothetical protein n=1 Tax=Curtobacterium luteum TaxID=33881 RepID=UPI0037FA8B7C